MRKSFMAATGLIVLGLLIQGTAFAQRTTTGDRKLDSLIATINIQERGDPDGFILDLSRSHSIPEAEIRLARTRYGLSAGDTFMATVLSRVFNLPIGNIAQEYSRNQGQGWGVMAMNRGIKPGSLEFKRMKAYARGSSNHMLSLAKAKKSRQNQELKKGREKARKNKGISQGKGPGKGAKK
jgi:hypothetical protein